MALLPITHKLIIDWLLSSNLFTDDQSEIPTPPPLKSHHGYERKHELRSPPISNPSANIYELEQEQWQ